MSRVGIGTVQFGMDYGFTREKPQDEVDRILDACVLHGINFLDTAPAYGNSEKKIGSYLRRNPKSGFVLAGKLPKLSAGAAIAARRIELRKELKASMDLLGIDRLDFLQLHQADSALLKDGALWEALQELRTSGLFTMLGVSIYEETELDAVLTSRRREVDFIQLPFSVLDQRLLARLPNLREAGIGVVSRSAMLKGMIPAPESKLPAWLDGLRPAKARLDSLASSVGLQPEELALLACVNEPGIDCTLIGVDSAEEVKRGARSLSRLSSLAGLDGRIRALAEADPALVDPRRWKQEKFH